MGIIIFYILGICTVIRSMTSNIALFFVLKWLLSFRDYAMENNDCDFIIIIPVLREQKVIEKTVRHFLKMKYPKEKITILIVTTEKEILEQQSDAASTIDVVENLKNEINKEYLREIVKSLHYPQSDGKMVNQLNFAFKYIFNNIKYQKNKTFISIYNADSRPGLDTLRVIANESIDEKKKIFQQSAIFFDNFHEVGFNKGFFEKSYLQANGTLHTRWTLVHEIPRFFRQSHFINNYKKRFFLAHCVGHGLFIRSDLLYSIKAMPTGTVTEDLFLGYVISLLGESINPIPVLEMAEMPNSFKSSLIQKYVWFFGPLDHLNYEKYFFKKYGCTNRLILKWFTLQGVIPAFIWLIQGWALLYLFMYPVISDQYYLLWLSFVVFIFYAPLSYWIILKNYSNLVQNASKRDEISVYDVVRILCFSFPVVFLHSIPPIYTIYSKIRFLLIGTEPGKPKTER